MTTKQAPPAGMLARDPTLFPSSHYPNVYRETVLHKDDRGKYIDPFRNLSDRRRLLYDQSHPDKIYGSQWSSELADVPSIYSFPTPTGLKPELPFSKDLQWQVSCGSRQVCLCYVRKGRLCVARRVHGRLAVELLRKSH